MVLNNNHRNRNGEYALRFQQYRVSIETHEDYKDWRKYFAPEYVLMRDRRRMEDGRQLQGMKRKKENYHYFRPSSERKWKVM